MYPCCELDTVVNQGHAVLVPRLGLVCRYHFCGLVAVVNQRQCFFSV